MQQRFIANIRVVLAATIAVDVMAAICFATDQYGQRLPYTLHVWSGLALGQFSVVVVWLVFRSRHDLSSWILPPLALVGTSYVRFKLGFIGSLTLLDYAIRSGLQMLVTFVVLWLLLRTPLWRRLSPESIQQKLQYSVLQMLFWMTCTAAVSMILARSTWNSGRPLALTGAIGLFEPAAVTIGVLLLVRLDIHGFVRAAGYVIVGVMAGMCLASLGQWNILVSLTVAFTIQAFLPQIEFTDWKRDVYPDSLAAAQNVKLERVGVPPLDLLNGALHRGV